MKTSSRVPVRKLLASCATATFVFAVPATAIAQDGQQASTATGLEDIIVSARRRLNPSRIHLWP
jgi:hypothetical protein